RCFRCAQLVAFVALSWLYFCFLTLRRLLSCPLFPYTTLFRSPQSFGGATLPDPLWARHRIPGPLLFGLGDGGSVHFPGAFPDHRSEEHTSELQSRENLVWRLLLEKKNIPREGELCPVYDLLRG